MARRRVERNIYFDDARKKYYVNFDFGLDLDTGKQIKKMRTFDKITEARAVLRKHEAARDVGQVVMPKEITAAEWLDLLADSNMHRFFENEVVFEPGKFYSATEVRTKFNQWRKARLKDRVYSAYSYSQTLQIDKAIQKNGSAFDELQSMVGLSEVKTIIKDIITAYKIQKATVDSELDRLRTIHSSL